jgi:hypothetical protein
VDSSSQLQRRHETRPNVARRRETLLSARGIDVARLSSPCHFGGQRSVVTYDIQQLWEIHGCKRPFLLGECAHFVGGRRKTEPAVPAQALGLTIPPTLLFQADELIR